MRFFFDFVLFGLFSLSGTINTESSSSKSDAKISPLCNRKKFRKDANVSMTNEGEADLSFTSYVSESITSPSFVETLCFALFTTTESDVKSSKSSSPSFIPPSLPPATLETPSIPRTRDSISFPVCLACSSRKASMSAFFALVSLMLPNFLHRRNSSALRCNRNALTHLPTKCTASASIADMRLGVCSILTAKASRQAEAPPSVGNVFAFSKYSSSWKHLLWCSSALLIASFLSSLLSSSSPFISILSNLCVITSSSRTAPIKNDPLLLLLLLFSISSPP
mmetsp:Transcript_11168/g.31590  ORF Transcript_11168/g.31590 Transcript_11168/m.31590 type:complete len:280 (+) Transcript_11168:2585-3424(+)